MDALGLALGLLLPWFVGAAAIAAARTPPAAPGEVAWVAGAGWFVGMFLLTLWMRALALAGVAWGVASIALPLGAAGVAAATVAWRRAGGTWRAATAGALRALVASPGLAGAARWVWLAVVAWLALRLVLLGLAVAWQPLYPWDAWMQWATKARVWYELRTMVPFAPADAWFAADGAAYFDAAPHYPPSMPLLQAWADLALGHWDDARMNLPWWQFALALALTVYGALARLRVPALGALAGAALVTTLPLANTHVALAGYADFPLAGCYTTAALALLLWADGRAKADAAVGVLLALACTQIKNPGLFWALTLVPGVLVVLLGRRGMQLGAAAMGVAAFLLVALARADVTVFNYRLHLNFDPAWAALGESYFLLGNWNLLWYGAIGAALLAGRALLDARLAALTMVLGWGVFFLFTVFAFTNAQDWVADQTTVNRATLHLAPLVVVFMVLAFATFAQRWPSLRMLHRDTTASLR